LTGLIDVPDRFALYLFGHMHESQFRILADGAGAARRQWQGRSLFGLEKFQERLERSHGYAAGRLEAGEATAKLTLWPRQAIETAAGYWRFIRDEYPGIEDSGHTRPVEIPLIRRYRREPRSHAGNSSLLEPHPASELTEGIKQL
jgi:hypothetical protein